MYPIINRRHPTTPRGYGRVGTFFSPMLAWAHPSGPCFNVCPSEAVAREALFNDWPSLLWPWSASGFSGVVRCFHRCWASCLPLTFLSDSWPSAPDAGRSRGVPFTPFAGGLRPLAPLGLIRVFCNIIQVRPATPPCITHLANCTRRHTGSLCGGVWLLII